MSGCRYDSYDTLDGDTMTWSRRDVVPGATLVQGGAVAGAELDIENHFLNWKEAWMENGDLTTKCPIV